MLKALQTENTELKEVVSAQRQELEAAKSSAATSEPLASRCDSLKRDLLRSEARLVDMVRKFEDSDLENTRLRLIIAAMKVGDWAGRGKRCRMLGQWWWWRRRGGG